MLKEHPFKIKAVKRFTLEASKINESRIVITKEQQTLHQRDSIILIILKYQFIKHSCDVTRVVVLVRSVK